MLEKTRHINDKVYGENIKKTERKIQRINVV